MKQAIGVVSSASRREKASVVFQEVSLTILPLYWESLFANIGIAAEDPLLTQSINDYLFEDAFCRQFAVAQGQRGGTGIDRTITDDEMNALRYMSGFIPHKLLRKYRMADSSKSRAFFSYWNNSGTTSLQHPKMTAFEWTRRHGCAGLIAVAYL